MYSFCTPLVLLRAYLNSGALTVYYLMACQVKLPSSSTVSSLPALLLIYLPSTAQEFVTLILDIFLRFSFFFLYFSVCLSVHVSQYFSILTFIFILFVRVRFITDNMVDDCFEDLIISELLF